MTTPAEANLPYNIAIAASTGIQYTTPNGAVIIDPQARNTVITAPDPTSLVIGSEGQLYYRDLPIEQICEFPYEAVAGYLKDSSFLDPNLSAEEVSGFTDYCEILREKSASLKPLALTIINAWNPQEQSSMEILQAVAAVAGFSFDDPEKAVVQMPLYVALINQRLEGKEVAELVEFPSDKPYSIAEHMVRNLLVDKGFSENDILKLSKVMDVALILHASHGSGNNSTLTAKTTASTNAELSATLSSATGSLSGPLHGGANEAALKNLQQLIDHINKDGALILEDGSLAEGATQEQIDERTTAFINDKIDSKAKIPGLGHAEYKKKDPRATIIQKQIAKLEIKSPLLTAAESLERIAGSVPKFVKKGIYPNVDFYSGIQYREALQLQDGIMTPLFAAARTLGWALGAAVQQGKLMRSAEMPTSDTTLQCMYDSVLSSRVSSLSR